MKNNILFLDIDGVLNVYAGTAKDLTYFRLGQHMEPSLVERFNEFLNENVHVNIVISSSWRDDMDDLQRQLEKAGFAHWKRVVGKTSYCTGERGGQIGEYISLHNVENYAIVDDYTDNILTNHRLDTKRVVLANAYTGISVANVEQLTSILRS